MAVQRAIKATAIEADGRKRINCLIRRVCRILPADAAGPARAAYAGAASTGEDVTDEFLVAITRYYLRAFTDAPSSGGARDGGTEEPHDDGAFGLGATPLAR
jgi:hypothetical protein